jgi:hypothetical protein
MNPSAIILTAAIAGLLVNTLAVLAVAWRGGRTLGHIDGTLERLSGELSLLREHPAILARVVAQLENLENRVSRLEGP